MYLTLPRDVGKFPYKPTAHSSAARCGRRCIPATSYGLFVCFVRWQMSQVAINFPSFLLRPLKWKASLISALHLSLPRCPKDTCTNSITFCMRHSDNLDIQFLPSLSTLQLYSLLCDIEMSYTAFCVWHSNELYSLFCMTWAMQFIVCDIEMNCRAYCFWHRNELYSSLCVK